MNSRLSADPRLEAIDQLERARARWSLLAGGTPDSAFERADRALYRARHDGRNRYEVLQAWRVAVQTSEPYPCRQPACRLQT